MEEEIDFIIRDSDEFVSYNPGLKVHPKTFSVQRINKLIDKFGLESFKDVISVGDTLLSVDNRILAPVMMQFESYFQQITKQIF